MRQGKKYLEMIAKKDICKKKSKNTNDFTRCSKVKYIFDIERYQYCKKDSTPWDFRSLEIHASEEGGKMHWQLK